MAGRSLHPEEAALWARVKASVRPMRPVPVKPVAVRVTPAAVRATPSPGPVVPPVRTAKAAKAARMPKGVVVPLGPASVPPPAKSRPVGPGTTLDGGWDRRIVRGAVQPDATLDLHGHTLVSAHALLDVGLARAIQSGARVLLLVTGKPPRPESERPHARGAIRAAIADWIGSSRHADQIAAVRGAHPRHGGAGALYIVLRRPRG
ncbi:DNA mismatch repair protein MutS [Sphingomonas sp. Leaf17]|uniref:Smr/MutS family protein n=1 Tax=Sphingomonas sp. Leaf17 TaxID=1735683 RepID=UPI0006FD6DCE|nr:Smr/MutS family protein [Sphingomonas sp. Leaf17]KQM63783.1 DNA mismatch repair protein MutS [Sphingomonas sp. Leaf17]